VVAVSLSLWPFGGVSLPLSLPSQNSWLLRLTFSLSLVSSAVASLFLSPLIIDCYFGGVISLSLLLSLSPGCGGGRSFLSLNPIVKIVDCCFSGGISLSLPAAVAVSLFHSQSHCQNSWQSCKRFPFFIWLLRWLRRQCLSPSLLARRRHLVFGPWAILSLTNSAGAKNMQISPTLRHHTTRALCRSVKKNTDSLVKGIISFDQGGGGGEGETDHGVNSSPR